MLSWIIQISIMSIIFIFLVHHLLCFFKTTLTVPKIKDLVNSPNKKYQQIFDTISNGNDSNTYTNSNNANSYTELDLLPTATDIETNINTTNNATNANANSMKNELKHFLKKQLNNEKETTLDTMSSNNNNNYAAFL